jgi:Ser/Thr protein kinase RdoA (MazF antagonist)
MDDPELQALNLVGLRDLAPGCAEGRLVERCLARTEVLKQDYAGGAYEQLTGWVIHGDYTPANLVYNPDGEVAGIFDFDWAMPGPRCLDVADGLYFFASEPREIDSASIWSLTEAARFSLDSCTAFLEAYQEVAPLTHGEIDAIPLAFTGQWLSIRLEGMAKVPAGDRFRFFSRGIEEPMLWLDAHWSRLRERIS